MKVFQWVAHNHTGVPYPRKVDTAQVLEMIKDGGTKTLRQKEITEEEWGESLEVLSNRYPYS